MATNGTQNGAQALAEFTRTCQAVSGPNANPRAKFVLDNLMKHLHQFATEVDLTIEEWLLACDVLIKSGKMSDEKRNELILVSDVLGIESLVDTMAHQRAEKAARATLNSSSDGMLDDNPATLSAILGPFYREGAPEYKNGTDIVLDHTIKGPKGEKGESARLFGRITDAAGKPVAGAKLDVWHTGPNGLYEQQDPQQPEWNYRGKFTSDAEGRYELRCLRPTAYPIPYDGGAGDILKALDRSPMRPAHIHFLCQKKGYKTLVTQIFDRGCPYIAADAVFATKDDLTVDFKPTPGAETQFELQYDIRLVEAVAEA